MQDFRIGHYTNALADQKYKYYLFANNKSPIRKIHPLHEVANLLNSKKITKKDIKKFKKHNSKHDYEGAMNTARIIHTKQPLKTISAKIPIAVTYLNPMLPFFIEGVFEAKLNHMKRGN